MQKLIHLMISSCMSLLLHFIMHSTPHIFIKCETNKNNETWKHEKMGMKFNELNLIDEIKY
jgi:hypothetical protein